MYYVYLLRCNDDSLYCGLTNNLEKRIGEHNDIKNNSTKYTRGRRPVSLVYCEKARSKSQALKREWEIKKMKKEKKEELIHRPKKRST